jgi:hypothetical protein
VLQRLGAIGPRVAVVAHIQRRFERTALRARSPRRPPRRTRDRTHTSRVTHESHLKRQEPLTRSHSSETTRGGVQRGSPRRVVRRSVLTHRRSRGQADITERGRVAVVFDGINSAIHVKAAPRWRA